MDEFKWMPEFSVDVTEMDNQHKKIIEYINRMLKLNEDAKNGEVPNLGPITQVLNELINYTVTHFRDEEAYMEKINYQELPQHRALHQKLVTQVTQLKNEFDTQGFVVVPKLITFLTTWLKSHILGIDKKYGKAVKK